MVLPLSFMAKSSVSNCIVDEVEKWELWAYGYGGLCQAEYLRSRHQLLDSRWSKTYFAADSDFFLQSSGPSWMV